MAPGRPRGRPRRRWRGGFRAVKVKIGRGRLRGDLEAIRAVRAAVGQDAGLMVDYNQALSVSEALVRARALDEEGLEWIEEPTAPTTTRGTRGSGGGPDADPARRELVGGRTRWRPSIAARACDLAMLDVTPSAGSPAGCGPRAWPTRPGCPVRATPSARGQRPSARGDADRPVLEHLDHAGPVLREPLEVVDGNALIPDRPGSGLAWDEERVAALLVER